MAKIATKAILRDQDGMAQGVEITFTDGRKVKVMASELPPHMQAEMTAHGISQKVGDSYSGCGGDLDVAYAAALQTAEALRRGEATSRATGGILAEAIARLTGRDLAEVQEVLRQKDKGEIAALRRRPDIKAAIKEIELERAKAQAKDAGPVELDDLLG